VSWFYPNQHGDVIVQADSAGCRVGVRTAFDPFGQTIDPATGNIGTKVADDSVQDTTPALQNSPWSGSTATATSTHALSPPSG
jgi:hypothetical protein